MLVQQLGARFGTLMGGISHLECSNLTPQDDEEPHTPDLNTDPCDLASTLQV